MVLTEVKDHRSELINAQKMISIVEDKLNASQNSYSEKMLEMEKVRSLASANKSNFLNATRVDEFNHIIQTLGDSKTDLEESHMKLRIEYRQAKDQLDTALAKSDLSNNLMQQLKSSKPSEMSDRLVEMSEKLQDIRLNEYRAKRAADELEERVKYLTNLLKGKNDSCAILEEKAAKCESELMREKENFRRRENERTR